MAIKNSTMEWRMIALLMFITSTAGQGPSAPTSVIMELEFVHGHPHITGRWNVPVSTTVEQYLLHVTVNESAFNFNTVPANTTSVSIFEVFPKIIQRRYTTYSLRVASIGNVGQSSFTKPVSIVSNFLQSASVTGGVRKVKALCVIANSRPKALCAVVITNHTQMQAYTLQVGEAHFTLAYPPGKYGVRIMVHADIGNNSLVVAEEYDLHSISVLSVAPSSSSTVMLGPTKVSPFPSTAVLSSTSSSSSSSSLSSSPSTSSSSSSSSLSSISTSTSTSSTSTASSTSTSSSTISSSKLLSLSTLVSSSTVTSLSMTSLSSSVTSSTLSPLPTSSISKPSSITPSLSLLTSSVSISFVLSSSSSSSSSPLSSSLSSSLSPSSSSSATKTMMTATTSSPLLSLSSTPLMTSNGPGNDNISNNNDEGSSDDGLIRILLAAVILCILLLCLTVLLIMAMLLCYKCHTKGRKKSDDITDKKLDKPCAHPTDTGTSNNLLYDHLNFDDECFSVTVESIKSKTNHPNVEAETENIPLYDHLDVATDEDTMVANSSNPRIVFTTVDAERVNNPSYDHLDVVKDESHSPVPMGSIYSIPRCAQSTHHGSYIKLHPDVSMHNLVGSTGQVQSNPSYPSATNNDL